jgi:invasion protein IalB
MCGFPLKPSPTMAHESSHIGFLCMRERPTLATSTSQRQKSTCSMHPSPVAAHSSTLLSPVRIFHTREEASHSDSHAAADNLRVDNIDSYLIDKRTDVQLIKQKMAVCPCLVKDQIDQDDLQMLRLQLCLPQKCVAGVSHG